MTGEVFIAGHSLGGARALLYAYNRIQRGLRVDGVYALAPPNPGDRMIGVKLSPVLVRSVRNGRDIVPKFPVDLPEFMEEYVQPRQFEATYEQPPVFSLFAWHHVDLYVAGCAKLPAIPAAIHLTDAAEQIARLYQTNTGWDWINPVDGAWWASTKINGATLLVARGSVSVRDWLDDFDATQVTVMGARVSQGFWRGVDPYIPLLDAAVL